jgi:hypothetical protein
MIFIESVRNRTRYKPGQLLGPMQSTKPPPPPTTGERAIDQTRAPPATAGGFARVTARVIAG